MSNVAVVNKTSQGPHSTELWSSESRPPEQLVQFASRWFHLPGHWKVEPDMVLLGKIELQLPRSVSAKRYLGPHGLLSIKKKKIFDSSHEQAKSGHSLVGSFLACEMMQ